MKITNSNRNDNRIGGNDAESSPWHSQTYHDTPRVLAIESESKPGLQPAKRHTNMIAAASTNIIANPNAAFSTNRPQVHQSSSEGVHGFGGTLRNLPNFWNLEEISFRLFKVTMILRQKVWRQPSEF